MFIGMTFNVIISYEQTLFESFKTCEMFQIKT